MPESICKDKPRVYSLHLLINWGLSVAVWRGTVWTRLRWWCGDTGHCVGGHWWHPHLARAATTATGQGVQCGPRLELVLGYSQHCEYCGAVTPRPALLGPARPARPGGRRHKSRRLISLQMHLLGAAANTGDCSSGSRSLQHAVLLGPTDGQHISSCREQSVLTYTTLFTFNHF